MSAVYGNDGNYKKKKAKETVFSIDIKTPDIIARHSRNMQAMTKRKIHNAKLKMGENRGSYANQS